ncbi:MAG: hypothetical protein QG570_700 [Patescibacteria group bacterium]|nr:hypothetical protein [Patescibacteria group bacterium]
MKLISKKTLIFLVVIVIVVFVYSRFKEDIPAEYYTVQRQDMELIVETSGYVESSDKADLYFEVAEKVTDVMVTEGEVVKKGDILATVKVESLAQSSQVARDNRDIAKFEKDLFEEKYASNMDAVGGEKEYSRQVRIYDENISKSTAQYNQSLINSRKASLTAPFDGTISKVYVNIGDLSSTNRPAIEMQDVSNQVLYTNISEVDIAFIDISDEVEIIFDAFPDKVFAGVVYSINPAGDTVQGVSYYKAEIKADNLPEKLRVGMNADMNILADKRVNVLYLPLYLMDNVTADSAVVKLNGNNGILSTELKIGLNNYKGVEIISGLNEGDTVVYNKD